MHLDDPNLAKTVFAAATAGRWPLPQASEIAVYGASRSWQIPSRDANGPIATIIVHGADGENQALANAFLLSQASATYALALRLASCSYATPAAQLIDDARAAVQELDRRARAFLEAADTTPALQASRLLECGRDGDDPERAIQEERSAASATPSADADAREVDARKPDTVVVYLDAGRAVRQRFCYQAEAMVIVDQAQATGTSAFMLSTENDLGVELVLELSPTARQRLQDGVALVRRGQRLVMAMDRHGIPSDRALRASIARMVDDLGLG